MNKHYFVQIVNIVQIYKLVSEGAGVTEKEFRQCKLSVVRSEYDFRLSVQW